MREPLLFSGIRWSGAKVVARGQVVGTDFDGKKVPWTDTLIIETTGKGRPYSVTHAEGWWRDFAELPLDDERRVLSFPGAGAAIRSASSRPAASRSAPTIGSASRQCSDRRRRPGTRSRTRPACPASAPRSSKQQSDSCSSSPDRVDQPARASSITA